MDQPLFGEKEKKTQVAFWIFAALISIFILFSVIIAIVYGVTDKEAEHFVPAVALIIVYAVLVVLTKWYRGGDMDPKMKWILVVLLIGVILLGVTVNVYVWKKKPVPPALPQCDGLYDFSQGTCMPRSQCGYAGYCVTMGPPMECVQQQQSTNVTSSSSSDTNTAGTAG
eukprot:TRINITY_DN22210_c0_g1_i1.p1 TRINITY_DN22210_c0_g1~~TRINITY_DN22210_c0_g1_i1.p1  ORF type:complete len:187 (+),score=38.61 TRINITY_DN22210_c0_g1_i1:57-563(+)